MRYRVTIAQNPDGLYAVWRGQVCWTQRSTVDGTMLLVSLTPQAPPEFDTTWNSRPAEVVTEDAVTTTYSLHTHCLYDDENYLVATQESADKLALNWVGLDPVRAQQLGLTNFSTTAEPHQLAALWQTRHDFPSPEKESGSDSIQESEPASEAETQELLDQVGKLLTRIAPTDWDQIAAQFRQLGNYAELEVRALTHNESSSKSTEGEVFFITAPPQLSQLFTQLRAAMAKPDIGTWTQGTLAVRKDAQFDFDFALNQEPQWRLVPQELTPQAKTELVRFPRTRENTPSWLAIQAELPLAIEFRRAATPNPQDSTTIGALSTEEIRGLVDYLYRCPVVAPPTRLLSDIFTPGSAPEVPDAFHTDGTWIWPSAVPYYLRKYGISPEPALISHIKANNFRPPFVREIVRETARAELRDEPYPPQIEATPSNLAFLRSLDRGVLPRARLRASEVLELLQHRLAEYGIPVSIYSLGEKTTGVWSLFRTPIGWQVAGPKPHQPARFARAEEASRFFLGSLLLYLSPETGESPSPEPEWPIHPMPSEPPLSFFHTKRLLVLSAGTELVRFGDEKGNLLHESHVRFPETALLPERERWRAEYRILRPIYVLSGVTRPWGALPGGALAYLLPHAVSYHLDVGTLERL